MSRSIRARLEAVLTVGVCFLSLLATSVSAQISFSSDGVPGLDLANPTSLDFGPDNRLYVSQRYGQIKVFTLIRNAPGDYSVTHTEIIDLIANFVSNHNDDGTPNSSDKRRQITGLMTAGTASNPVLYVTSSDPRVIVGTDSNLDTNSGVISRLTCTGGMVANACSQWDRVDIVRGLSRSEENHATNGMDLDEATNTLYVMAGGHANQGAPGYNFAGTPEYYLSASMLKVDLDAIETMEASNGGPFLDDRTSPATQFVYDLVTLDDPTRVNIDNTSPEFPYESGHPYYHLEIDPGDPFGGNNSLNQAIPVPGGPVQIHSPGYRNAFDVVVTQAGDIYTWDNGPNSDWGGLPVLFDSTDTQKSDQNPALFDPGAGDYCSNAFNLNNGNGQGHGDVLHNATASGYYGGHPAPIRAFPGKAGLVNFVKTESGWEQSGPVYDFKAHLPVGYGLSASDFADDAEQCEYKANDPYNGGTGKYLEKVNASTNGLTEYTATNFSGTLKGDLLAASFNGYIYRCKLDGSGDLVNLEGSSSGLSHGDCEVLLGGFGSQPLDVIAQGDDAVYPGTIWAVTYGESSITVFEPTDFGACNPIDPAEDSDNDGYTNGDEDDNGTDPCNGGSRPDDADGDGVSDLNDADDDNDGIPDVSDPFALDASNGLDTQIPLYYPFFNDDPGTGLFGLGFTGLMLDTGGADTWLELFDPEKLAAGGATGQMSVEEVTAGDAHENSNSQKNAFLLGINADSNTPPFVIHSRILPPYFGSNLPNSIQSFGIFLGTGDMDNFVKLVLQGNSSGAIEVTKEENASATVTSFDDTFWNNQDILAPGGQVDLYLSVNPQAGTVQAQVSLNLGATIYDLGSPLPIPSSWLDPADEQGLAIGLISTAENAGTPYTAVWDFINVEPGPVTTAGDWEQVSNTLDEIRHEGGFVQAGDKFYLVGGRESQTVRIYDPATQLWSDGAASPVELHHFQAVEYQGLIYVMGAMTGSCCAEDEADYVYIYDPLADTWITGPEMPLGRERAGGGAAVYNGKIYVVSGNTLGHSGPVSAAVDMLDPATGIFTPLADIPNPRDHFFATVAGDLLYAIGGRTSGNPDAFSGTVPEVDVLDLTTGTWSTLPAAANLPTPRAGAATGLVGNEIIVAGGASGTQAAAHQQTEALDLSSLTWRSLSPLSAFTGNLSDMKTARQGSQAIVSNNGFYIAAGSPHQDQPDGAKLDLSALFLFGETDPSDEVITAGTLIVPDSFDFGDVQSGSISNVVVTLSNTGGNQAIVIESVALQGNTLFETTSPWGAPVVLPAGETLDILLAFAPGPVGPESGTLVVTHSGGAVENIDLMGNSVGQHTPVYRVNNGGPLLAATDAGPDWASDTAEIPSPYFLPGACGSTDCKTEGHGPYISKDPAVPAYVPDALFETERWDPATGSPMQWAFPVSPGTVYVVRLYLMNGYAGTNAPGQRVFDISVEGVVPTTFANIDPTGIWGHKGAGVLEHQLTASDDTLNIDFDHLIQNPLVNGVEIMEIGVGGNLPPQITQVADQTSVENDDVSITVYATDSDGPSNVDFSATGLPPGLSIVDPSNGHLGGTINAGAANGSPYAVTVTANDGVGTSQMRFTWIVTPDYSAPDLPPDVDGDGILNGADNNDDNDLLLDSEDPFALDADNGLSTDLPVSLPMFSTDPGTGLFGLGFTGLMTNGVIGGAQGDDYQDLYEIARVVVDNLPANDGVLTLLDIDEGDAHTGTNTQTHAFQLGLNVDIQSQAFVVHSRMLAPWFDDVGTPQNYLSQGMFVGNGDQDNYLKMVFDGADNDIQIMLEDAGLTSSQNVGDPLLGSAEVDMYLIVDANNTLAYAQASVDGGALTNVGNPVNLPATWLDDQDEFGLAMGLITTSNGVGPEFSAHFDLLEAFYLAADDAYSAIENDPATALDVLLNDHLDPGIVILSISAPDNGGSATIDDNGTVSDGSDDFIIYTPATDFIGTETFGYTIEDSNGVTATALVSINVEAQAVQENHIFSHSFED